MKSETFTFKDPQDYDIFVYKWLPDSGTNPKAVVQIAHGMQETAARYERFAAALTQAGYAVYANDHRGHGQTAKSVENLGYCGTDGFNWMAQDLYQLTQIIQHQNPKLPIFLFGHSMGSFLLQQYITEHGNDLQGAILSGTSGNQGFVVNLGIGLAKLISLFKGTSSKSPFLNNLSFGSYNKRFQPIRTKFDWLSRDNTEIDKYIANPYCGFICSTGFYYDLFRGLKLIHRNDTQQKIPHRLPIHFLAGTDDPVGNYNKTIRQLIDTYQKLGVQDLSYQFYQDGRHEMLNEINRAEVTHDIITWLDARAPVSEN